MQLSKSKKFMVFLSVFVLSVAVLLTSFAEVFKTSAAATYKIEKYYSPAGYGQQSNTQVSSSGMVFGGGNWSILVHSGNLLYCLEPGKAIRAENYKEKSFVTEAQSILLGRVFLYGYTQVPENLFTYGSYMPQYIATQLLVWEVVCGQRDMNFEYKSNGYAKISSLLDNFNNKDIGANVKKYYQQYETAIKAHKKSISFAYLNGDVAKSKNVTVGSDGTYTFTDKNGQLNNFDVKITNGKVVSKTASQLKISVDNNKLAALSFTQNNVNTSGERCGFLTLGEEKSQTMAFVKADPRKYYVYAKGLDNGNVDIKKTSDDGNISGIKFSIEGNGIKKQTATTDKNGYLHFKDLKAGVYTVTEELTAAQANNYNSIKKKTVVVSAGQTATVSFHNTKRQGHLSVTKYSEDDKISGIGFDLISYTSDHIADNGEVVGHDTLYDTVYTDKNGYAEWDNLPYYTSDGKVLYYWVDEVSVPPQYKEPIMYMGDYNEINIDDGQNEAISFVNFGDDIAFTCFNEQKKSEVKLVKKDTETGKIVAIAGTEFSIYRDTNGNNKYDDDDEIISMANADGEKISSFVTDKSGEVKLPEKLSYGTYYVMEVTAPDGYIVDKTPVFFSVTKDVSEADYEMVVVEKADSEQKGQINVVKTGKAFTTVTVEDNIYTPVFDDCYLEGAVFDIIANENIYYPSTNEVRVAKDTVVDTVTTGADGTAISKELYLGSYRVIETKAPDGYVLNKNENLVDLVYAGQTVTVTNTETAFENQYQGIEINVSKFMESAEDYGIDSADYVQYVKFGLFANDNITAADEKTIPKDGLIEVVSLTENFTTKFNSKLPFGKYYVKEIATDEKYIISDEVYEFEFSYGGQDVPAVKVNTDEFVNELKKGSVRGNKVDSENHLHLENAVMGLFMPDTEEFTKDTAIKTTISNSKGEFEFTKIPYGSYFVKSLFRIYLK